MFDGPLLLETDATRESFLNWIACIDAWYDSFFCNLTNYVLAAAMLTFEQPK